MAARSEKERRVIQALPSIVDNLHRTPREDVQSILPILNHAFIHRLDILTECGTSFATSASMRFIAFSTDPSTPVEHADIVSNILCYGLPRYLHWYLPQFCNALLSSAHQLLQHLMHADGSTKTMVFSTAYACAENHVASPYVLPAYDDLIRTVTEQKTHQRCAKLALSLVGAIVSDAPLETLQLCVFNNRFQCLLAHLWVGSDDVKAAASKALAVIAANNKLFVSNCIYLTSVLLDTICDLIQARMSSSHFSLEEDLIECLATARSQFVPGIAAMGNVEKCIYCLESLHTVSLSSKLKLELCRTLHSILGVQNRAETSQEVAKRLLPIMQILKDRKAEQLIAACIANTRHPLQIHNGSSSRHAQRRSSGQAERPWKAQRKENTSSEDMLGWNMSSELADLLPVAESENPAKCADALAAMRPLAKIAACCGTREIERDFFEKLDHLLQRLEAGCADCPLDHLVLALSSIVDMFSSVSAHEIAARSKAVRNMSFLLWKCSIKSDELLDAKLAALKCQAMCNSTGEGLLEIMSDINSSNHALTRSIKWTVTFSSLAPIMMMVAQADDNFAILCRKYFAFVLQNASGDALKICIDAIPTFVLSAKLRGKVDKQWALENAGHLIHKVECMDIDEIAASIQRLENELEIHAAQLQPLSFKVDTLADSLESILHSGERVAVEAAVRSSASLFRLLNTDELEGCSQIAESTLRCASSANHSVRATVLQCSGAFVTSVVMEYLFSNEDESGYICILRVMRTMLDSATDIIAKADVIDLFSRIAHEAQHHVVLEITLSVLVGSVGSEERRLQAAAQDALVRLSKRQNTSVSKMLQYSPYLMEMIGWNLVDKPIQFGGLTCIEPDLGRKELVVKTLPHTITAIAIYEREDLLHAFANELGTSVEKTVNEFGHYAVADIMLGNQGLSQESADMCKIFLGRYLDVSLSEYISEHFNLLLEDVIDKASLGASDADFEKVAAIADHLHPKLQSLASLREGCSKDVPKLLQPVALQSLYRLSQPLMTKTGNESSSSTILTHALTRTLFSLCLMCFLLGSKLAIYVHHVRPILGKALEIEAIQSTVREAKYNLVDAFLFNIHSLSELRVQVLQALRTFIYALSFNAPQELGDVAEQIVVAVLPILEDASDTLFTRSVELLNELIVRNKEHVSDCMARFPVLPEHQDLQEINRIVENQRGTLSFEKRLSVIVESLTHDSVAVKQVTLRELIKLLQNTQTGINCILKKESDDADQTLGRLVGAVFKCAQMMLHAFKNNDAYFLNGEHQCIYSGLSRCCAGEGNTTLSRRMQLTAADALAHISAIDPHRVVSSSKRVEPVEYHVPSLGRRLLCEHVLRIVRGRNDFDTLLNALYAAQEILKFFGCGTAGSEDGILEGSNEEVSSFWSSLPSEAQEALKPCLSSRYVMRSTTKVNNTPIFEEESLTFNLWISHWCIHLQTWVFSSEARIIDACKGLIMYDTPAALFLLPHLILFAVRDGGEEAIAEIQTEISTVLQYAAIAVQKDVSGAATLEGKLELSTQAVFSTFDKLCRWLQDYGRDEGVEGDDGISARIQTLLDGIPGEMLAKAAFNAGTVSRSLQHYENHIRQKGTLNQARCSDLSLSGEESSFLSTVAQALEEEDMVTGFEKMRSNPTVSDHARRHEQASEWQDALTIYENQLINGENVYEASSGRIRCLWGLGYSQEVLKDAESMVIENECSPRLDKEMRQYGAAAAWRLGEWARIENLARDSTSATIEETFSLCMQSIQAKDVTTFQSRKERIYNQLLPSLAAAGMEESYQRAFPFIVRLHALKDMDTAIEAHVMQRLQPQEAVLRLRERKKTTQKSLHTLEPLLKSHKTLFQLMDDNDSASDCWLELSKICRQSGEFAAAQSSLLQAERTGVSYIAVALERAKLIFGLEASRQHRGLSELENALRYHGAEHSSNELCCKAKIRLARWSHELGTKHKAEISEIYKDVIRNKGEWEKSKFFYAKFMDDLLLYESQNDVFSQGRKVSKQHNRYIECLTEALRNYGESLQQGHKHIYESLPRILTLWFDYTSGASSEGGEPRGRDLTRVLDVMKEIVRNLPTYQWLVVMPQLVSRICHPHSATATTVKYLLKRLLITYPQRTLWALTAATRSKTQARSLAGTEILNLAKGDKGASESTKTLISSFSRLSEQLVMLCYFTGREDSTKMKSFSIAKEFPSLKRMLPSPVMVPVQKNFEFQLPQDGKTQNCHKPFQDNTVTIEDFEDAVTIMSSLQKPKKLTVICSDGSKETFLSKPKDDLRKDLRMMELTTLLNRILSKEHDSRQRNLCLRTFAVTPLSEDCGILEWVCNTRGLRHILQDLYAAENLFDRNNTNKQIKREYDKHSESELINWYQKLLHAFPPILHRYFLKTFAEPSLWVAARNRFTRTAAAWSMVGHIVGLGDRHGENILLDSETGDAVHVDFSCLFDKGLELERPELVPFRLTQNMIDAFGISGIEGIFFQSSQICMRVLRSYKDALMAVLDTFVHDPLVEWTKAQERGNTDKARNALKKISSRLTGVVVGVGAAPSPALSPQGQARRLIAEASSQENLCKMFIWWQPWM